MAELDLPVFGSAASRAQRLRLLLWGQDAGALREVRRQLVASRARSLALAIAALVLLWIPIDIATLQGEQRIIVVALRLGMALLAGMIGTGRLAPQPLASRALLVLLITAQCLFFGTMQWAVDAHAESWVQIGYRMFPFLVVAQFALFPLALRETLLLAVPVTLASFGLTMLSERELTALLSDIWLLCLLLGVAMWAAAGQLGLLDSLLRARNDAAIDPLTGLANRRQFQQRLHAELSARGREARPLSLLSLDLDHFKRVNDNHGHAVGDEVLIALAKVLRASLRGADMAVRLGGEEFAVLLPDTALEVAKQAGERIRQAIETAPLAHNDQGEAVFITCSLGLAQWQPGERPEFLLQRADRALYAAKSQGRNRLVLAEPAEPSTLESTPAPSQRH